MINDINAQSREHIFYDTLKGVLLYHNDLANYPLHWHNEVELLGNTAHTCHQSGLARQEQRRSR